MHLPRPHVFHRRRGARTVDKQMFWQAQEGPKVFRLGGSQVYHTDEACSRLKRPQKGGVKLKTPSTFELVQAKALGWKPCAACSQ